MKKKLGIVFLCLLLCGCSRPVELKKQTFTIELGQDVYANPALYVKDQSANDLKNLEVVPVTVGIVKSKNRFISMGHEYLLVGEYDFEVRKNKDVFPFKIKIKDTKPPTLTHNPSQIYVPVNTVIDWGSYFAAEDLSGVEYSATQSIFLYRGENFVDLTISDHFGNSTVENIKVIVE